MVETAELRDGDDFASGGWQYWTGLRGVLVKREFATRDNIESKKIGRDSSDAR
jgi:hypothetical protein